MALPPQTMPDPVVAALIARLPVPDTVWPAKKRAAWMQMLWLAFDVVYHSDGDATDLPPFLVAGPQASAAIAPAAPPAPAQKASPFAFLIDKEGFAKRGDGVRILPTEVGGVLYDERGEGDLGTITWADGTQGVRGLQIDISPAF